MKLIILVAVAFVALAAAAPPAPGYVEQPKILRSEYDQKPDGQYVYGYETENGIARSETGDLKEVLDEDKKPHSVIVVRGTYSYTNPDGTVETITYTGDEFGFHADGPSIPKAPARR